MTRAFTVTSETAVPYVGWANPSDERKRTVAEAVKVNPERRMLIDGKLVEADSGKAFDNVNPAT